MMGKKELEESNCYKVVLNHEEQYSIWPDEKENPLGWIDAGISGPKSDCLDYINKVWTDMRPLSLRKKMEELEKNKDKEKTSNSDSQVTPSLVSLLFSAVHPVEIYKSEEINIKEKIENGYIHIKFPETKGGTVLGVKLEQGACNLNDADFEGNSGSLHLEGRLTLDYVEARCIVNIDIQTNKGTGDLRPVEE